MFCDAHWLWLLPQRRLCWSAVRGIRWKVWMVTCVWPYHAFSSLLFDLNGHKAQPPDPRDETDTSQTKTLALQPCLHLLPQACAPPPPSWKSTIKHVSSKPDSFPSPAHCHDNKRLKLTVVSLLTKWGHPCREMHGTAWHVLYVYIHSKSFWSITSCSCVSGHCRSFLLFCLYMVDKILNSQCFSFFLLVFPCKKCVVSCIECAFVVYLKISRTLMK